MVSQFISSHTVRLLGEIDFDFPDGIHAIGRLDNHSEGLLILTTNKKVTRLLFGSKVPHYRTYRVLVLKKVSAATIESVSYTHLDVYKRQEIGKAILNIPKFFSLLKSNCTLLCFIPTHQLLGNTVT